MKGEKSLVTMTPSFAEFLKSLPPGKITRITLLDRRTGERKVLVDLK